MAGPEQEGRKDEPYGGGHLCRGGLKPLTPLHEVPEPEHTKGYLTVKALPATEPHKSVIDVQRQQRIPLATVAQEIGDRHSYDLFES
jgi:hypothetical protein